MEQEILDVLIVGSGISGIGAGAGLAINKILTPNFFAASSDLSKSSWLSIFFAKWLAAYFPIAKPITDPRVSPIHMMGIDK